MDASKDPGYYTQEDQGKVGSIQTVEQARAAHHLASADPEPERDGLLTGPAHEAKYGLERADSSAANWVSHGVHPTENRALVGDEEGAENLRGAGPDPVEVDHDGAQDDAAGAHAEGASE